jgi:hypothetical protein
MADVRRLARNIGVDVSIDNVTFLNLKGRVDNAPQITPNKVDSTDVDTNGFTSAEITLQSGVLTVKYNALINSGVPNPAQEMVRSCVAKFGDAARLYVRWYDTDGGLDAWSARSIVELQRSSTNVPDLMAMQATFTLDGTITPIANPFAAALAPVVLTATPGGAGVGALVTITGQGFTGVVPATGVKFGAVTAPVTAVHGDSVIVAVMPAGSAGAANVTVTNPVGVSNSLSYTRT